MRLSPLPADQWDEQARNSLSMGVPPERRNPGGTGNALATLVRHPELTRAYMPLSVYLKDESTLPLRIRELIILRLAHRTKCEYQWTHHATIAAHVGLSDDEVAAAIAGVSDDPLTTALFAAVDELVTDYRVSEGTWAALGAHFDEQALIDLVFTIGGYAMQAMAINSFGVQVEGADWRSATPYTATVK